MTPGRLLDLLRAAQAGWATTIDSKLAPDDDALADYDDYTRLIEPLVEVVEAAEHMRGVMPNINDVAVRLARLTRALEKMEVTE